MSPVTQLWITFSVVIGIRASSPDMDQRRWTRIARRQYGVISRNQLNLAGVSDRQIDLLVASGALQTFGYGVWLAAPAPASYESQLWRAVLVTGGVIVGRTAAHLWGLIDDPGAQVDIAVQPERRVSAVPGVSLRRTEISPTDTTLRFGLRVTDRRRSAIDYLASCCYAQAMPFADRAISQGWFTEDDLRHRLETRRRGNPVVRQTLRSLVVGAEAESERRLQRLLRDAGIRDWIGNYEVFERGRVIARVDVAFPAAMLAIEVDGFRYHSGQSRFQRDRTKQNDLVALGWTVLRFTWSDLVERPEYVLATVRRHVLSGEKSTA